MKLTFALAAGGACVVCLFAYFGASQAMGAHPRWAFDVALYGAPIGIMLAAILSVLPKWGLYWALFDLGLAGLAAWWGKAVFVASSAENTLAGQFWFFGWIAVCGCAGFGAAAGCRLMRATLGTLACTRYHTSKNCKGEGKPCVA